MRQLMPERHDAPSAGVNANGPPAVDPWSIAGGPASMAEIRCSPVALRHRLSTALLLAARCAPSSYGPTGARTVIQINIVVATSGGMYPFETEGVSRPDLDAHALAPQLAQEPRVHPRGHLHYPVHLGLVQHFGVAVQRGEQLPVLDGHVDPGHGPERLRRGAEYAAQPFHPARGMRDAGSGARRREQRVRVALPHACEERVGVADQIGLVEDVHHSLAIPYHASRIVHPASR